MADAAHLTMLARHVRQLHALAPPRVAPFDPAMLLAAHVRRIGAADPSAMGELEALLVRAADVLQRCEAGGRPPCVVHNDLHHTNVLSGERLWLLDFEYAAVTDPLFDLACLTAYYPAAARHAPLIIEESGLAPGVSVELLAEAAWLYVLLSYLWYRALRLTAAPSAADTASERALAERLHPD
jgi:thiamine kinase-like enzyme